MVNIYSFDNYKAWIQAWVEDQPKKGFGEYRRMAQALRVSTTMISQVFKGDKHLSMELASELCDYLSLNEDESDYFLLLVELGRAGSHKLQVRLRRRVKATQDKAKKLETRLKATELNDTAKAVFYSNWLYSGVRLLTDIEDYKTADAIAKKLNIPRAQIQRVLEFLLEHQLVIEDKGKLKLGTLHSHLTSSSPFASRQHQNYRLLGFNKMLTPDPSQFFFTSPMALSQEVAEWIRAELPAFVEKMYGRVLPSKSEKAYCLNIDWFEY